MEGDIKPLIKWDRGTGGMTVFCKKCHSPIEYIRRENAKTKLERPEEIPLYCKKH